MEAGSDEEDEMKLALAGNLDNCLFLCFDDIDPHCYYDESSLIVGLCPFNNNFAIEIFQFVEKTEKEKKDLIVHCTAGISRSAAVSKYANNLVNRIWSNNEEDFWLSEKSHYNIQVPNPFVLSVLNKISIERNIN